MTPPKADGPHENSPSPPVPETDGVCAVVGFVDIDDAGGNGGIPLIPQPDRNHNHFLTDSLTMHCEAQNPNLTGTFLVEAAGGTDGPGDCDGVPPTDPKCHNRSHGEDSAAGWSHSDCYVDRCDFTLATKKKLQDLYDGTNTNEATPDQPYNFSEIAVVELIDGTITPDSKQSCFDLDTGQPDATCNNWMKFCRGVYVDNTSNDEPTCSNLDKTNSHGDTGTDASIGGSNILAWGALTWDDDVASGGDKGQTCFLANLELAPDPVTADGIQVKQGMPKLTNGILEGTAVIWEEPSKKDTGSTNCDDGAKKNKT